MKKSFETQMYVDGKKLPLNNFVQETIGNIMMGVSKTLKGLDTATPNLIEVKILRAGKNIRVGIKAPNEVDILRTELLKKSNQHNNT